MKCQKCNQEITDEKAVFCPHCGELLDSFRNTLNVAENEESVNQPVPVKKKKKSPIIPFLIVIILVLLLVVFYLFYQNDHQSVDESISESVSGSDITLEPSDTESSEEEVSQEENPFEEMIQDTYQPLEETLEVLRNSLKSPASMDVSSVIVLNFLENDSYYIYMEVTAETGIGVEKTMYAYGYYGNDCVNWVSTDEDDYTYLTKPSESYAKYYKVLSGRGGEGYTDEGYDVYSYKNNEGVTIYVYEVDLQDYKDKGYLYVK